MSEERSRGLGLRFGVATAVTLAVVVGLVLWGGRLLPAGTSEFTPLTVLTLLLAVMLVLALVRLPLLVLWPTRRGPGSPFDRLPSLENELRGFIEDYEDDIEVYRTEFAELGAKAEPFVRELDSAESDLERADRRLRERRYVSAFRRYYQAQRELVDVTPGFEMIDEKHGQRRDRFTELVDQVRHAAEGLSDPSARSAVERHLVAFEAEQGGGETEDEPTAVRDLSRVKMAIRRIHAAQVQSLSSYLKLRRFLKLVNVAMGVGILAVVVAVVVVILGEQSGLTPLVDIARALGGSFVTEGRLLFVPMVFGFGALGAVLNILRRLGGPTLFEDAPTLQELPDDLIMMPSLVSRVLWGAIAAFVVFLFTSLSGEFSVSFVVLTAIVSGFSEQLLEDVLTKHHDRLKRSVEDDGSTEEAEADTTLAGVTYDSRGRLVIHGASESMAEEIRGRYADLLREATSRQDESDGDARHDPERRGDEPDPDPDAGDATHADRARGEAGVRSHDG